MSRYICRTSRVQVHTWVDPISQDPWSRHQNSSEACTSCVRAAELICLLGTVLHQRLSRCYNPTWAEQRTIAGGRMCKLPSLHWPETCPSAVLRFPERLYSAALPSVVFCWPICISFRLCWCFPTQQYGEEILGSSRKQSGREPSPQSNSLHSLL